MYTLCRKRKTGLKFNYNTEIWSFLYWEADSKKWTIFKTLGTSRNLANRRKLIPNPSIFYYLQGKSCIQEKSKHVFIQFHPNSGNRQIVKYCKAFEEIKQQSLTELPSTKRKNRKRPTELSSKRHMNFPRKRRLPQKLWTWWVKMTPSNPLELKTNLEQKYSENSKEHLNQ